MLNLKKTVFLILIHFYDGKFGYLTLHDLLA